MSNGPIVDQADFEEFCEHIRQQKIVALDTEFVAEDTYRPELCLLQLATPERRHSVDPFEVRDLQPLWDLMGDADTTVVVHGGREEIHFCLRLGQQRPQRIVDIQVAQGLCSQGYPLSYSAIVSRVLDKRVHGKETRTDWRRRPLSQKQLKYALEDVEHILPIWSAQSEMLEREGRLPWAEAEFERIVDEAHAEQTRENWHRLPSLQSLSPRELAVVRELYRWRREEAERQDRPVRRIMRDDLLLELARRQPRTPQELFATRDMQRRFFKQVAPDIVARIAHAIALPDSELPQRTSSSSGRKDRDERVLGKLLGVALANRCAEAGVSMALVGTSSDLQQLVHWHLDRKRSGSPPRLEQGWRAEVCGYLLKDMIEGKISLRVGDPHSDHPLKFERTDGSK